MAHSLTTAHKYPADSKDEHGNEQKQDHADDHSRGINEQAQRKVYGGFNIGAAFFGWLVAVGIATLVIAILTGAGSAVTLTTINNVSANTLTHNATTIGLVSGLFVLVALAIAYYAGGYVAGRMSRFDGARQGFGVWALGLIITLVLGALGAIFSARFNLLQQLNLPHIPSGQGTFTKGGLITFILTIVITFVAATIGGKTGERYHRKIDNAGMI
jgi:hypothetical protein